MTPIAAGVGAQLQYVSSGKGEPLLAIHGLGGSAALLSEKLSGLATSRRVIAYDRRGYGQSDAPEPYRATTVSEQSADAAALVSALDASPALLVGVGFGALVALDLCLRHPQITEGAVLVDPPLYSLDVESTRELADQRGAIEAALLASDNEAAIASLLGSDPDQGLLASAQSSGAACFADYAGLASLELTHRQLRECQVPVRILLTTAASPAIVRIASQLDGLLGNSALLEGVSIVAAAEALLD